MTDNPQVKVQVTADTSKYVQETKAATAATTRLDRANQDLTRTQKASAAAMTAMAGRMQMAGVAAGAGIAAFYTSAIQAATNLQDATSKVGVVFGGAAREIEAFAADSSRSFGLTKTAAMDATSQFAVFGKAAGLAGKDLADWSIELTQRAVDLSSFFGGTTEEAVAAVGSALMGQYEPVRKYGAVLDENSIKQAAFEMKLISSTKEGLNPQIRALVVAEELLRKTSDAAGDYNETSGGAANSVRNFNAELGRLKEQLGTEVLPVFTTATKAGTKLFEVIQWLKDSPLNAPVIPVPNEAGGWDSFWGGWGPKVEAATEAAKEAAPPLDEAALRLEKLEAAAAAAGTSVDALGAYMDTATATAEDFAAAQDKAASSMFGYMDAQLRASGSADDLLGAETRLRDAMRQTVTVGGASAKSTKERAAARKAESKALQDKIDAMRKADKAEADAEIASARRAAERKAERRADAGARKDVQQGVAKAIETDKAARAGKDLADGFNQGSAVGEATGSLTKGEQKALDDKIDGIRKRHQKALDDQINALRKAAKAHQEAGAAASSASKSVDRYSTSLDANTEAGRKNRDALRSEMGGIVTAAEDAFKLAILGDGSVEEALAAAAEAIKAGKTDLLGLSTSLGFRKDEVLDLLGVIGKLPESIILQMKALGLEEVLVKLGLIPAKKTVTVEVKLKQEGVINKLNGSRGSLDWGAPGAGKAAGGKVRGPGSWTSDSVPTHLSRDEWVIKASSAAKLGDPFMAAVNSGDVYRAASMLPSAAPAASSGGGFNIDASGWQISAPSPAAAARSVIDALAESAYRSGVVR